MAMTKLASKAMESYGEDEMGPPAKDDYSADLESELGAMFSALKAGDLEKAARAFREAASLCK